MDDKAIKYFVEAALLAAGRPLSIDQIQKLFDQRSAPEKSRIRQAIGSLIEDYTDRGITISEVASGFRMQIEGDMVERLQKLWEERPPRYSRALFETLSLIAYRQPMTRGEIEEIRGVAVSTNIIRSLLEREWVRIVGHRDVPGRPAMFGTTKQFLDYFGLKKLDDLPPLADLSDWESLRVQLNLPAVEEDAVPEMPDALTEAVDVPAPYSADDAETDDGDFDSIDDALAAADIEPIAATEWPDPNENVVVVRTGDADEDAEPIEERESAEATQTGA